MDSDLPSVTRWHRQLRGLVIVPLAVPFLIAFVWKLADLQLPGVETLLTTRLFLILLFAACLPSIPLSRRYARQYDAPKQKFVHSGTIPLVLVALAVPFAVELQQRTGLKVSLLALLLGGSLAGVGLAHYRLRSHYLAAGLLFIGFAFLGELGVSRAVGSILFHAVVAASLLIVGIGDHRLLTRTLVDVRTIDESLSDATTIPSEAGVHV